LPGTNGYRCSLTNVTSAEQGSNLSRWNRRAQVLHGLARHVLDGYLPGRYARGVGQAEPSRYHGRDSKEADLYSVAPFIGAGYEIETFDARVLGSAFVPAPPPM